MCRSPRRLSSHGQNIQVHLNDDAMDHLFAEKVFEETMAFKTRMCTYITKKQTCPYGDRCRFAHCAKDLFSRDDNFLDASQKKATFLQSRGHFPGNESACGCYVCRMERVSLE